MTRRIQPRRAHQLLWAPWRKTYISHIPKIRGCLFCKILTGRNDRRNLLVKRSQHAFAVLNRYPYNNGHVMIVPNRHVRLFSQLKDVELLGLMRLQDEMLKGLRTCIHPHGFNVGTNLGRVGGAGVPGHIHVHLVPRWLGDNNFMPAIGGTKVISQSLSSLYQALTAAIQAK